MVNLITQAEYAKHRGVSEPAVSKAIKAGRISLIDGKIDPVAADAQWARNSRARAHVGTSQHQRVGADADDGPGAEDYWASRSRRENAEADIATMKAAEMRGELVRKADVDRASFEAARSLRDGIANCSKRLGATVAVLATPDECAGAIERELRALLVTWSRTMGVAQESAP